MQDKEDEIGFLETEKRVNIGKDLLRWFSGWHVLVLLGTTSRKDAVNSSATVYLFYFISLGRIPRPSRAD